MRIKNRGVIFLLAAAVGMTAATVTIGPWATKDFADWTDKDARAVVTHSPWAKEMPMPINDRPAVMTIEPGSDVASSPSASLGNPANTTTGGNMGVAAAGNPGPAEPQPGGTPLPTGATPSGMRASAGAPSPQPALTVIWASATPVRLAVLKLRSKGAPSEVEVANAKKERDHYVIALIGLPAPQAGSDPKTLASGALLSVKGRPPLQAADSDYRRIGKSDVYFFRFVRASLPIAVRDRQVEFQLKFGQMEIKTKFDPNEMEYRDQLAL